MNLRESRDVLKALSSRLLLLVAASHGSIAVGQGLVTGSVFESETGLPIAGVPIAITNGTGFLQVRSDTQAKYSARLGNGCWEFGLVMASPNSLETELIFTGSFNALAHRDAYGVFRSVQIQGNSVTDIPACGFPQEFRSANGWAHQLQRLSV
jgi:hypothetical protein